MTTTSRPTPLMLAGRPRVTTPAPVVTDNRPFRQRYERAIRYSGLGFNCRLVALTVATWADWETGQIPEWDRPGIERIATASGLDERRTRSSVKALVDAGYLRRIPAASTDQPSHIELTIPPGARTGQ